MEYINGVYWVGSWANSSWTKTLCIPYVQDEFGNLVRI
jgi:hypothetical protein